LTWYEPQFAGLSGRVAMEGFDAPCRWMYSDEQITATMIDFNAVDDLLRMIDVNHCNVITFSHFIPRTELFFGWSALREVMGSERFDFDVFFFCFFFTRF
jgi:hypothetical protein